MCNSIFDNDLKLRALTMIEAPLDNGQLTKRTARALALLATRDQCRVVRDLARDYFKYCRRMDECKMQLWKEGKV